MTILNKLRGQLIKPEIYAESEKEFWTDGYISQQLLTAHLDQTFDGASRKLEFIKESIEWIAEITPVNKYRKVIDLGCGPGLYAERLARLGYTVNGIDFSQNSIAYAINEAKNQQLTIDYRQQDYLQWQEPESYDLALLIYCDYGALSPAKRKLLLKNIYESLKSGGRLIIDVFSLVKLQRFESGTSWETHEESGFWSKGEHLTLANNVIYDGNVTLEQTVLLKDETLETFNIWHHYFDDANIALELQEAGFSIVGKYADVRGKKFNKASETIAFVLEK